MIFAVFFLIFFFLELSPFLNFFFYDNSTPLDSYFIFITVIFILFNLSDSIDFKNYKSLNLDIISRFFFFFKSPSYFLNFIINNFKKIFLYILKFKYKHNIIFFKIMFRKVFSNLFLLWKPLFKKTSYFGFYRSNRSKWIK